MTPTYDTAIIGAGLAGACTALHLAAKERILVVEAGTRPRGASVVAAGLANPYMARKARPVWRQREALAALKRTADAANASSLVDQRGILRPAADEQQAGFFRETAEAYADCRWLDSEECAERYPGVRAPLGALLVTSGVAVDIRSLLDAALAAVRERGGDVRMTTRLTDYNPSGDIVQIRLSDSSESDLTARRLLLCMGDSYDDLGLDMLDLHRIKGQTIEVRQPSDLTGVPHLAGMGYVVNSESRVVIGSSYQHEFHDVNPDPVVTETILCKAAEMVPSLANCKILKERAGIRVTVPGTRLPMVGPLPGLDNVWVFTGLSSKGLLMAPLIASDIWTYMRDPNTVPAELRVRTRKT